MSDDIFEGDDTFSERVEFLKNLDLFSLSNGTKNYWKLADHSALHTALYLMITKGMSFESGEKLMNKIRGTLGKKDMNKEKFTISDKTLKEWGLSAAKIQGIRTILSLDSINSSTLCKVKEGGLWLIKMHAVLAETNDDTPLYFCYEVKQNLAALLGHAKILSDEETKKLFTIWTGYRSQISYFLYRIKPESIVKILDDEELDKFDFNGCDKKPA